MCAHVFKQHGLANIAHRYASGNHCRACLKVYASRDGLIHHFKYYRTGCLVKLSVTVQPLTDEALATVQTEVQESRRLRKRQQRASGHVWPVTQAFGPLRPWPWQLALSRLQQDPHKVYDANVLRDHPAWISDVLDAVHSENPAQVLQVLDHIPYHCHLQACILRDFSHMVVLLDPQDAVERRHTLHEALALWGSNALLVED